jgi:hypothetical protein
MGSQIRTSVPSSRSVSALRERLSKLKGEKKMATIPKLKGEKKMATIPSVLTAPSGTFDVSGNWSVSGGTGNLGNVATVWSAGSGTSVFNPAIEEELKQEIAKIKEIHLNVAKDQENRICELESAVTELMEFMKDQLKLIEEIKKQAQSDPYPHPPVFTSSAGIGAGIGAGYPTPTGIHIPNPQQERFK